jgi:hypothetical protein
VLVGDGAPKQKEWFSRAWVVAAASAANFTYEIVSDDVRGVDMTVHSGLHTLDLQLKATSHPEFKDGFLVHDLDVRTYELLRSPARAGYGVLVVVVVGADTDGWVDITAKRTKLPHAAYYLPLHAMGPVDNAATVRLYILNRPSPANAHARPSLTSASDRTNTAPEPPTVTRVVSVITGELKSKIDRIWDSFWSGGISNPLEVIEQVTYLLFLRRLDELQILAEKKARVAGGAIEDPQFLPGQDHLRWSRFKNLDADVMYKTVSTEVFPFLQKYGAQVGGDDSTYSDHMKDARFTIPTPALLSKVVDMLDDIPMHDRDTSGDLYEYLLQDRVGRCERAVPYAAPHHRVDGGHDGAATGRRDLRPCLRHGRLPGRSE